MKRIIIVALAAFLAACTTPSTPAQAIYAAHGGYATALAVAVAYKNLPDCALPSAPVLCKKMAVLDVVQKADDVAYATLTGAQATIRTPGVEDSRIKLAVAAATNAVAAFQSIVQTLEVK